MFTPLRNSLIFLFFGLIYLFLIPPLQTPDAQTHFYRAYHAVSTGAWLSEKRGERTGGEIATSLAKFWSHFAHLKHSNKKSSLQQIKDSAHIQLDAGATSFIGFENTAVFSPLPYLPSAIGILISKSFTDAVLVIYYSASFFTLLASTVLIFLAMSQIPNWSGFIFAVCMLPMSLNLFASLSADSLSNAISILFVMVSLKISLASYDQDLTKPSLWPLILLGVLLALSKQTYAAVLILPLAIPYARFSSTGNYLRWFFAYSALAAIALFGWAYLANSVYSPLSWINNANPQKQMLAVLQDLPAYGQIVLTDLSSKWQKYSLLMAGARLGWEDVPIPFWLMWCVLATTTMIGIIEGPSTLTTKRSIQLFLLGVIITIVGINLIELALYLHANSVGSNQITGVHGRYFLIYFCIFTLAVSALISRHINLALGNSRAMLRSGLIGFSLFTMSASVFFIYSRYYVA